MAGSACSSTVVPIGFALILLDPVLPVAVTLTAVFIAGIVATLVVRPPVDRAT